MSADICECLFHHCGLNDTVYMYYINYIIYPELKIERAEYG